METSLADQRASDEPEPPVALTPGGEEEPWYAGSTIWLVGIAVVLISLIIWGLRRRSAMAGITIVEAIDQETVQVPVEKPREFQPVSVPGEATRVQEPEPREDTVIQQPEAEEETVIQQPEPEPEEETAIQQPVTKPDVEETIQQTVPEPEEEEQAPASDDPEVSLDLARAYLSMGDKEAARSMLGEAIQNGNAEQVAEARLMMEEL
jgi:FimV-like protein